MKNFSVEYVNLLMYIINVIELHSKVSCSYEFHCGDLVKVRASLHSLFIIYYNYESHIFYTDIHLLQVIINLCNDQCPVGLIT